MKATNGEGPGHGATLAVAGATALLLLAPLPAPALAPPGWASSLPLDKAVHALLFGLCAVRFRSSLLAFGLARAGLLAVVAAALYGGLLELAQEGLASRSAELGDFLADLLGAALAVAGAAATRRAHPGRTPVESR